MSAWRVEEGGHRGCLERRGQPTSAAPMRLPAVLARHIEETLRLRTFQRHFARLAGVGVVYREDEIVGPVALCLDGPVFGFRDAFEMLLQRGKSRLMIRVATAVASPLGAAPTTGPAAGIAAGARSINTAKIVGTACFIGFSRNVQGCCASPSRRQYVSAGYWPRCAGLSASATMKWATSAREIAPTHMPFSSVVSTR
jgi:hypothetical protein